VVENLQLNLLDGTNQGQSLDGLRYVHELINANDERALVEHVRALPFRELEFHGMCW
jgi:hypothetical protein